MKYLIVLEYLSNELVISSYHMQRVFKRVTGMTPAQFFRKQE
jgi:methylphosphotriester-DNA--protein-cysteine methyltransferase